MILSNQRGIHTYEELCSVLDSQFAPKISVFCKREEFYSLRQTAQELVNEWYVRLKNSALSCKFKRNLKEVLRDKFVTGLRGGLIKDRLCEEEPEVELNKLVELAIIRESSVKTSFSNGTEVHRMGKAVNFDKWATEKEKKFSTSNGRSRKEAVKDLQVMGKQ